LESVRPSAAATAIVKTDQGRDWWRALKAIAGLARNTEDTSQVFEIIHALAGNNLERTYRRMARDPVGRALIDERASLNAILMDRPRLAAMPEGSLGRVYLQFMVEGEITADGLEAAQDAARANDEPEPDPDPEREYVAQRLVEQHDLWHVLTGYGRDDTGELANLWFSYGQFRQLGMAFIAFMGCLDGPRSLRFWRFMRSALRRGRRARNLVACRIEDYLERPLDEARRELGVRLPHEVHPEGIYTGNRRHEGIGRGPRLRATSQLSPG
jgi:ubiquinone biosynthesis protein COQ4